MTRRHVYKGQYAEAIVIDHSSAVWELDKQSSVLGGIYEAGSDLSHNRINVLGAVAGDIDSGFGIWTLGDHASVTIGVAAVISATSKGVMVQGDESRVVNNGRILSNDDGIVILSDNVVVTNNGTVSTSNSGIQVGDDTAATFNSKVVNHGLISGGLAFYGSDGDDTLINDGTIKGGVELGGGDDLLDTRNGSLVDAEHYAASIRGGSGDDVLITDSPNVFLNESDGTVGGYDWVKSTVSYSLAAHPWGDAVAANVEGLALLGKDNITGTGNIADNHVNGNAGNNVLKGLAGQDRLDGASGNDTLRGGADGDVFVFETGGGRDKIADFDAAADHIDLSNWKALTSFSDLKHHHLTVSGPDLVVRAGDDMLTLAGTDMADLDQSQFIF